MATAAVPAVTARSGVTLRRLRKLAGNVASLATAAVRPHRASLRRLADMPLTVAGYAALDFAAFHYIHMIGWAVLGVTLIVTEHQIADDTNGPE